MPLQQTLFDTGANEIGFDRSFRKLIRTWLDERSWIDHAEGWVTGSSTLFDQVVAARTWAQRERWMYTKKVKEPRLTSQWNTGTGQPIQPAFIDELRRALSAHYALEFDSVGFNLYRDGNDGVAWHRDRIRKDIEQPIVALVSLGSPRKLMFRPYGGGKSLSFPIGHGDLLVTGGRAQREWEHAILKVAHAEPRISLAFRHGLESIFYTATEEKTPSLKK